MRYNDVYAMHLHTHSIFSHSNPLGSVDCIQLAFLCVHAVNEKGAVGSIVVAAVVEHANAESQIDCRHSHHT